MELRRPLVLKNGYRVNSYAKLKPVKLAIDLDIGQVMDCTRGSFYLTKAKVVALMDDIDEIKLGMGTNIFINYKQTWKLDPNKYIDENKCLSIVMKNDIRTIDLVAPSQVIRDEWHRKLVELIAKNRFENDFQQYIREQFREADLDASGSISFHEILKLLNKLKHVYEENEVKTIFQTANFRHSNDINGAQLDLEEFMSLYQLISHTKTIDNEFHKHTSIGYFRQHEFIHFIRNEQKIHSPSIEKLCTKLIEKYEPSQHGLRRNILTSKGFRNLLMSPESCIVHPRVHQDMTRPLTDYFIATSHNTYLPDNQLDSQSTTETYRIYLLQGCRSVELDISDGDESTNYEPVVFHKRTITAKVKLSDIATTIREYSFKNSPYPVIISLENNCATLESQRQAAAIFVHIFGQHLITQPLYKEEQRWPSPEELKYKIIIRGKRIPTKPCDIAQVEKEHHLAKELSDLVWYGQSKKFISFDELAWDYNCTTSLVEGVSKRYYKQKRNEYRKMTRRYLTKVYPHGLRVLSGNYNPIIHWQSGAQMISLNYQTKSNHVAINHALFESNGNCGYVLKPEHLLTPYHYMHHLCNLTVIIFCAFNLPQLGDSAIDPYVELRLFGVRKYKKSRQITKVIQNNGVNPEWNSIFKYRIAATKAPLAFLRFRVLHSRQFGKDVVIASRMVAFSAMNQGYRNIPLFDYHNRKLEIAKIIVHIKKEWV